MWKETNILIPLSETKQRDQIRHDGRIRSLPFVSSSPASCLHSILFYFMFSGIVLGFYYLFRHCVWIFLVILSIVSEHRLSFSASRLTFIIFFSIVPGFSSSSLTSCLSIGYYFWHRVRIFSHLPWHCVRASLIFFDIASGFLLSSSASCPSIAYLFRHRIQLTLSFLASCLNIAYLFWHRVQISISFSASCASIAYLFHHQAQFSLSFMAPCSDFPHLPRHRVRASLIFLASHPAFSFLHWHCVWITHLPRHST